MSNDEIKKELKEMEKRIIATVKQELNSKTRKEKEHKKILHNTKLLLRNYSNFVEHYRLTEFTASTLIDEDILELIEYKMDDDKVDDTYIKSLFKTKEKTAKILNHINRMMDYYEKSAIETHDIKKQRAAKVLRMVYLERKRYKEISEELNIDKSTVSRDVEIGIEDMSPLLFGIDGVKLD